MQFETARTYIRKLHLNDYEAVLKHRQSPLTSRYIGPVSTPEDAKARVEKAMLPWQGIEGERLMLAIVDSHSQQLIGELMFKYVNRSADIGEFGYRLAEERLGQGLGFEVSSAFCDALFTQFGLNKLTAIAACNNVASWKLMEKLGMQREGLLREHMKLDSGFSDAYIYGILRKEWQARPLTR